MKAKVILLVISILYIVGTHAQQHLPESKSLVGLWRQAGIVKTIDGEIRHFKTGNYKVMNPDGTFYAFITWGVGKTNLQDDVTTMNFYGTYTLTSDSTFTEHIVTHSGNPTMSNTDSELRYKFIPDTNNDVMYMKYKNPIINEWIPEVWERVVMPLETQTPQTQTTL